MDVSLLEQPLDQVAVDWLVLPCFDGAADAGAALIDEKLGGALSRLREAGDLPTKPGELLPLADAHGIAARRLLLVGLGKQAELTLPRAARAVTAAVRHVCTRKDRTLAIALPALEGTSLSAADFARLAAIGINVGSVSQQLYRGEPERHPLKSASLVASKGAAGGVAEAVRRGIVLGESMNLTRELVNRHPGEVYPETFADRAAQVASGYGLHCEVFDEQRLAQERMQSLLSVARGSSRPARMVVIEHRGAGEGAPWLAFAGKGVTFDSGGLSLKQSDQMKSMKADMAGAATVLGAMCALARLKAPVNVIGLMGLVENMPGASAYKLGEVLTARNGVTIEVLNTDAEGRLVLADVLSYAVDRGAAKIVDLATLTGSCVVALGEEIAGAFSNNEPWQDAVLAAAAAVGEDLWPMPMHDAFAEQLKSDVADVKNIGTRWGGSITAAKFLQKFVHDVPWVHLDIAGPAFAESTQPHKEGGGTGAYVQTLVQLAEAGV